MNVLMITPVYEPNIGGIENYVKELSLQLKLHRHNVTICVINTFYENKKCKINEIDVYYIKAKGKFPFIYFDNLNNYLTTKNFDIVHIHDPHIAGISFHFLINNYSIPKILSSHGGIFHNKNNLIVKKIYWNTIARILIRQYKKIICVSFSDYEHFNKISNKNNLKIIESGININKFKCIETKSVNNINKTFIYFGRWSKNKGILNLIKVFEILFKLNKVIKLTLVGKSDDFMIEQNVRNFASRFPENVTIYPFLEENYLRKLICNHDFFITATEYEGFGISILEAISSGRIGIINNIPPLNHIFKKDEVFFVNFSNIEETAKKIQDIISLPSVELEKIRKKGMKKAKSYAWEKIFPKIESLYKEVIKSGQCYK